MYSPVQMAFKYLRYYITALNGKGHGIHSPFVFDFVQRVLNDDRQFYAFRQIENLRQLLLNDQRMFEVKTCTQELVTQTPVYAKRSDFIQQADRQVKFGQLFFRMADRYAPLEIVELGTTLGINTAYLAMANNKAVVTAFEKNETLAAIVNENCKKLGIENCRLIIGDTERRLSEWLLVNQKIGMVLVDSCKTYASTIGYFSVLLKAVDEDSILIFGGIHSSKEMEQAWEEIKENEIVTLTIDLFFVGIVFFRKEFRVKQNTSIRF